MNEVQCPNCNTLLPPQEITEGWCESCGRQLPNYVREAARSRSPIPKPQDRQPEPRPLVGCLFPQTSAASAAMVTIGGPAGYGSFESPTGKSPPALGRVM